MFTQALRESCSTFSGALQSKEIHFLLAEEKRQKRKEQQQQEYEHVLDR
jgi:hypothetical protein